MTILHTHTQSLLLIIPINPRLAQLTCYIECVLRLALVDTHDFASIRFSTRCARISAIELCYAPHTTNSKNSSPWRTAIYFCLIICIYKSERASEFNIIFTKNKHVKNRNKGECDFLICTSFRYGLCHSIGSRAKQLKFTRYSIVFFVAH